MGFYPRDHQIYDESYDIAPADAVEKGDPLQTSDVFGFWLNDTPTDNHGNNLVDGSGNLLDQTFVYRMRQVLADKLTGSGEDITALEKVYAVVGQNHYVTANPTGTAGTDYYFCGWAKEDAGASDEQVLINFDGTRYNEDI